MADEQTLSIKIKIDADTKKLTVVEGDLKTFEAAVKQADNAAGNAGAGMTDMEGGLKALGAPLGVDIAAFTGVAGAIGLVGATIAVGISKWEEEQKLNREVAVVVNGLGLSYDKLKSSIDENLESLSANTRFTGEETKKSFATALKYTGDTTQAYRLLQIAQNTAVASNKSLTEVMDIFGSAMKGGERSTRTLYDAFGKLGVQGKTVSEMIENLGQTNTNTAKTEESLEKTGTELKEAWEDTASAIGGQLLPSLVELGDFIKPFVIGLTTAINLVIVLFLAAIDRAVLGVRLLKDVFTLNFKDIAKATQEHIAKESKRLEDFNTSVIKAADRMNTDKKKMDKDYGKFKADTLKGMLGDEKQFSQDKDELARKLDKIQQENAKDSYTDRMALLDAEVVKYRAAGAKESDILAYYAAEKTRITFDEDSRRTKAKKELEGIEADKAKKTAAGQVELLRSAYEADLGNYKTQLNNKELTQEEYDAIRLAREQQLATNITAVWQAEFEAQMGILSGFMGSLTTAFGEATAIGKTAAIAQATMDTYAAANKALATYPPPFGFIAAGTAVVSGLANVAKISSVPMMAEGGIVDKATMVVAGERGREAIIPLDSMKGKSILSGAGGGAVNIQAINIQFPNVSNFSDWLAADPKVIKDVVEKKILQAFNQLAKEGKMSPVSKVKNI